MTSHLVLWGAVLLLFQGVLLGYVLLDLAFDVAAYLADFTGEARKGMLQFYLNREGHPTSVRVLLLLPLVLMPLSLLLVAFVAYWNNGDAVSYLTSAICTAVANVCGSQVMGIRRKLGQAGDGETVKKLLRGIVLRHIAMLPLMLIASASTIRLMVLAT
uniref:Uncharacterized protein n=1 Tax=Chromera velia CCMP2878 TaxID=1169474 RepID=A0A0G4HW52_9ALVE|mmetsp:Transcript_47962/g.94649  ORF Transcript_47962/g.94649 Transcript_47962/m.94649 type:complete len:159 (+) Transcript_47962:127-603(+)|eukprot:Cvel_32520.t1-p1 / transcript=Cvel_32520.t1 / gene=Cvel_32520 / organism=Chromera_velia_CCMP2878 / gene_product=hypothetical protein / transcript_product=hypothetical protein / location=Cvel_scaffold5079:461-934(-) / protein_length=158 / sequence_SO=supercontig / SO=protein_coding / is_pseudo=false